MWCQWSFEKHHFPLVLLFLPLSQRQPLELLPGRKDDGRDSHRLGGAGLSGRSERSLRTLHNHSPSGASVPSASLCLPPAPPLPPLRVSAQPRSPVFRPAAGAGQWRRPASRRTARGHFPLRVSVFSGVWRAVGWAASERSPRLVTAARAPAPLSPRGPVAPQLAQRRAPAPTDNPLLVWGAGI